MGSIGLGAIGDTGNPWKSSPTSLTWSNLWAHACVMRGRLRTSSKERRADINVGVSERDFETLV